MEKKKVFFGNLDGLRFFAFALVFLQHAFGNIIVGSSVENQALNKILTFLFIGGGTGVSVFFVLSGFLITYLLLVEININGRLDIKAFYIRRSLRIWPLYFFVVVFAFQIYPFIKSILGMHSNLCSQSLYYYLFLANFDVINIQHLCPGQDSMIEAITWSVAIEEQFYLVWPLLFFLVPKRYFIYVFFSVIALSLWFRWYNINDHPVLYFHTLSVCGDLAVGGLGAYFAFNSKNFIYFLKNLKPGFILMVYLLGLIFCIFGFGFNLGVFDRLIRATFFLFIILEQNFNETSSFKLSKMHYISKAGKYTYGYYLLHPVAILIVSNVERLIGVKEVGYLLMVINGVLAFIITVIISYFSYHYFEAYFIRLKSRFSYISKD